MGILERAVDTVKKGKKSRIKLPYEKKPYGDWYFKHNPIVFNQCPACGDTVKPVKIYDVTPSEGMRMFGFYGPEREGYKCKNPDCGYIQGGRALRSIWGSKKSQMKAYHPMKIPKYGIRAAEPRWLDTRWERLYDENRLDISGDRSVRGFRTDRAVRKELRIEHPPDIVRDSIAIRQRGRGKLGDIVIKNMQKKITKEQRRKRGYP